MTDYANKTLRELADEQIANHTVDPERLNAIKNLILADNKIDDAEIAIIDKMIFATKDAEGFAVGREEVELLFAINDETTDHRDNQLWQDLFVKAVCAHVLHDEDSEGLIDETEALWLIDMIEADGQYDNNEIALLKHLMATATEIPNNIKFRLGMILAAH